MNASVSDGKVIIGTSTDNIFSFELSALNDPLVEALNNIDGERTLEESIDHLSSSDRNEFLEFFSDLIDTNIVVTTEDLDLLRHPSYLKYDRQINYFYNLTGDCEKALSIQHTLIQARISLIGLGGVGSFTLYNLASMGIGYIRSYDFDKIEISNISRQILYDTDDVGKLKTEVAYERTRNICPESELIFVNEEISDLEDAIRVFEGVDIVVSCADIPRPDFFYMMGDAANETGVPIIYGGSSGSNYIVGPLHIPKEGTASYRDIFSEDRLNRSYRFVDMIAENYRTTLINPFNSMAASLLVMETVKFLTGCSAHLENECIVGNVKDCELEKIKYPSDFIGSLDNK